MSPWVPPYRGAYGSLGLLGLLLPEKATGRKEPGPRGIGQLADVQAFHVAVFVKHLQGKLSPPTVKQHLAALRMLFDWLATGHVLDVNPACAAPNTS